MDMSSMSTTTDMASMATSTSMSMMSMVFTNSEDSPLYSSAWTPNSSGAYAGTCIFLIALALFSRCIIAYRHSLEMRWQQRHATPRFLAVADQADEKKRFRDNGKDSDTDSTERMPATQPQSKKVVPWRLSVDLPRALIFTVQAGIGYLLMLAVMTMNVGYFFSVLAGLFVGELFLGRHAPHASLSVAH